MCVFNHRTVFLTYPFFQFTGLCIHAICPLPCLFLSHIIVPHWPFEIPIFHLYSLGCFRLLREHWTHKHEFIVFALCPMFGRRIISIYISIGFSSNYVTGFFKHTYIYIVDLSLNIWTFEQRQRLCSEFWMTFFYHFEIEQNKRNKFTSYYLFTLYSPTAVKAKWLFFYLFF